MQFSGAKAAACLLGLSLLACGFAYAQHGGTRPGVGGVRPGMGGGFPGGMGHGAGPEQRGQQPRGGGPQAQPRMGGNVRPRTGVGPLTMGPPGRWWDDRHYVQALKLRPDQQKRMDSVFETNRGTLQQSLKSLQQEQAKLSALEQTPRTDETALFAQIDRVAAARTALEKADAHVRLELRKEMDADQVTQLEKTQ